MSSPSPAANRPYIPLPPWALLLLSSLAALAGGGLTVLSGQWIGQFQPLGKAFTARPPPSLGDIGWILLTLTLASLALHAAALAYGAGRFLYEQKRRRPAPAGAPTPGSEA